jgi:hypothetical protein
MPAIPATQEAEIRKIMVQSWLGKEFSRPYLENAHHAPKKSAGGVAQGEGPEFKPQYYENK